jgi:hypothetical protein
MLHGLRLPEPIAKNASAAYRIANCAPVGFTQSVRVEQAGGLNDVTPEPSDMNAIPCHIKITFLQLFIHNHN